jgi:hypothetical protein
MEDKIGVKGFVHAAFLTAKGPFASSLSHFNLIGPSTAVLPVSHRAINFASPSESGSLICPSLGKLIRGSLSFASKIPAIKDASVEAGKLVRI